MEVLVGRRVCKSVDVLGERSPGVVHIEGERLRGGPSGLAVQKRGRLCGVDHPIDETQVALAGERRQEGGVRLGATLLEAGEDLGCPVGAGRRQALRAAPQPVSEDVGVPCLAEFAAGLSVLRARSRVRRLRSRRSHAGIWVSGPVPRRMPGAVAGGSSRAAPRGCPRSFPPRARGRCCRRADHRGSRPRRRRRRPAAGLVHRAAERHDAPSAGAPEAAAPRLVGGLHQIGCGARRRPGAALEHNLMPHEQRAGAGRRRASRSTPGPPGGGSSVPTGRGGSRRCRDARFESTCSVRGFATTPWIPAEL